MKFEVPPTDVAGKILAVGDSVAFCRASRSSSMVVGKVLRLTKKQVEIEHIPDHSADYYKQQTAEGLVTTMRNFDCVAKV